MKRFLTLLFMISVLFSKAQTYFTIDVLQDTLTIAQGQSATFNVSGTPYLGFSASLAFSATATPCNLNSTFSPSILNSPYTNTNLLISNTFSVRADTFDIVVKAENGVYAAYDTCVIVIESSDSIKWTYFSPQNSGLTLPTVITAMQDKINNDVWVAQTTSSGLSTLSRFNGYSWEAFDNQGHHTVSDFCGNIVWDSTGSPINGLITAIYVDSTKIWVAMGTSIRCFSRSDLSVLIDYSVSSYVIQIAKDEFGNMWFAANYSGLWKYDGVGWINFNSSNSPINHDVLSIVIDRNNKLWVGTWGSGLIKYDGAFWTVYNTSNSSLPENYFQKISLDDDGSPIVTGAGQFYKFDGINTQAFGATDRVRAPAVQIDSLRIWFNSGSSGLRSYDGTTTPIIEAMNMGVTVDTMATRFINDMMKDSLGNVWISTDHGLAVYNKDGLSGIFNSPRVLYNPIASVPEHQTSFTNENFLYPNPSNGRFTMALNLDQKVQLNFSLYDAKGLKIRSWTETSSAGYQERSLDLSQLPAGLYYFSVSSDSFSRSQKVIIAK